jgi:hypothetical protein
MNQSNQDKIVVQTIAELKFNRARVRRNDVEKRTDAGYPKEKLKK